MRFCFRLVFGLSALLGLTGHSGATSDIKTVDFCTAVKSPEKYDKKVISTKGILLPGEHSAGFYSPACTPSETNKVNTQGVLEESASPKPLVMKLRRLLKSQSAAKVEAEGVFYSDGGPFGPDVATFRFVIQRLKFVEKQF